MSGQLSRGRGRLEAGCLHGRDSPTRDVSAHRAGLPAAPLGPARRCRCLSGCPTALPPGGCAPCSCFPTSVPQSLPRRPQPVRRSPTPNPKVAPRKATRRRLGSPPEATGGAWAPSRRAGRGQASRTSSKRHSPGTGPHTRPPWSRRLPLPPPRSRCLFARSPTAPRCWAVGPWWRKALGELRTASLELQARRTSSLG